ncbi:MAG: ribosome recycling factor [Chitinophagaceae bacterium]
MQEELTLILEDSAENMKKAILHLEVELTKIRAGKANPQMLEGILVDYYGSPTPLNQVANISVADARTLTIQPFEKNMLQPIERAIIAANLGMNPQGDGQMIRIFLPPLTEDRRKELVKRVNAEGESAKVSIRSIRRETLEQIKRLQKEGLSEDMAKDAEADVQVVTDKHISLVEKHCASKDKEIMSI